MVPSPGAGVFYVPEGPVGPVGPVSGAVEVRSASSAAPLTSDRF